MIEQARSEHGGIGKAPPVEHMGVAADPDRVFGMAAGEPLVVHHDAAAGACEGEVQHPEGDLEPAHPLPRRHGMMDPSRCPAHAAVTTHPPIALDILEEEQHGGLGSDGCAMRPLAAQRLRGAPQRADLLARE
jgi:hypothetical protein